jgi:nucleotide-binding universal stress UspA family protein
VAAVGTERIVVGVDGSAAGRAALQWAVGHAAGREDTAVHAVAALQTDGVGKGSSTSAYHKMGAMLDAAIDALPSGQRDQVEITRTVLPGSPGDVLADQCAGADMLVLGGHGHGKAYHMLLGWTSEECVRKVDCPVVIVPPAKKSRSRLKSRTAAKETSTGEAPAKNASREGASTKAAVGTESPDRAAT